MQDHQPLFFRPEESIEKTAGEVDLPEDPNQWPQEILQELYKQVPYITDYQPHVEMQKADAERGYGFGHVEIMNQTETPQGASDMEMEATGVRSVRIPFVIKDKKLSPFDLLINDSSKVVPLTENRLRQSLFRPQAFDVTSKTPGDQSMIGQLYPPYRTGRGFGGGGVALNAGGQMGYKLSSAQELEQFLFGAATEEQQKEAGVYEAPRGEVESAGRIAGALAGGAIGDEVGAPILGLLGGGLAGGKLGTGAENLAEGPLPVPEGTVKIGGAGTLEKDAVSLKKVLGAIEDSGASPERLLKAQKGMQATAEKGFSKAQRQRKGTVGELYKGLGTQGRALKAERAAEGAGREARFRTKTSSVLEAILPTINHADHVAFCELIPKHAALLYQHRSVVYPVLNKVVEATPEQAKMASWEGLLAPSIVQVQKRTEGYMVKTANHFMWSPKQVLVDRGEVVHRFGVKIAQDVDTSGAVTMQDEEGVVGEEATNEMAPVETFGLYKVKDTEGAEYVGFVVPELIDTTGETVPLALFTNGSHTAVQADIEGEPAGQGSNLPSGPVGGYGAFYTVVDDGSVVMTIPLELGGSFTDQDQPKVWQGTTLDGSPVEVSVQPNIQEVMSSGEGRMLVPETWNWLPLDGSQSISLIGGESEEAVPELDAPEGEEKMSQVVVRSDGQTFSFSGHPVEKLASDERNFLDINGALFLLAGLGVHQVHGAEKLASVVTGLNSATVKCGRQLSIKEEQIKEAMARAGDMLERLPQLKQPHLLKEAAAFPDPTTVDTVLSLGFINPENILTYVSYLPDIEDSQTKLCELLLGVRLGLSNIQGSSLERAVRSLEETIEGLKVLAFQGS